MSPLYTNMLVRYMYGETNEMLKKGVKRLLLTDIEFKDLYTRLTESKRMLDKNLRTKQPRKSLVDNILKYGAS